MTNARLKYNGVSVLLAASMTAGQTSISFVSALKHSGGTNVPTLAGGDWLPLAILDGASGALTEIVNLTAYTAGALTGTVVRGAEGTTGVIHAAPAPVILAPTVEDFQGEAWAALPSLASGWADLGSGFQGARYKRHGRTVILRGSLIRSVSTYTAGATIATLPSGWRPAATNQWVGDVGGVHVLLNLTSGGLLSCVSANVTVGQGLTVTSPPIWLD